MTCEEFAEFLGQWFADELPSAQAAAFAVHLRECQACEHYLASYRRTVAACRRLQVATAAPAEMPPALVEAILASRRPH